ncbi:hypothetical protein BCR42DRAFT_393644 [Absidia repens]|uniref:Uncharacterized protein n=1 Tax=Absidia repens TaxID=90262 RepID=A0A1X2ICG7_9FUNG|nr:hypothetical protein BCR42DRAFT_393644 [Absidia repens]
MLEKIVSMNHQRQATCQLTLSQLKQGLVALTCFQVIRALWQVWGSIDSHWPVSIHGLTQPMTYISCSLVIALMLISASTTYSVYKKKFVTGCYMDKEENLNDTLGVEYSVMCSRIWQETVIWAILDTMVNLTVNANQSQHTCINYDSSSTFHRLQPIHSTTTTLADIEDNGEFHFFIRLVTLGMEPIEMVFEMFTSMLFVFFHMHSRSHADESYRFDWISIW